MQDRMLCNLQARRAKPGERWQASCPSSCSGKQSRHLCRSLEEAGCAKWQGCRKSWRAGEGMVVPCTFEVV